MQVFSVLLASFVAYNAQAFMFSRPAFRHAATSIAASDGPGDASGSPLPSFEDIVSQETSKALSGASNTADRAMDSTLDFLQKGEEGDEDEEDDELDMFEIYEDSPDIDIPYDLIAQIEAKEAQALAEKGVSGAEINQAAIEAAVAKWRKHDKDTGSAEVQIVIANEKVKYLTKHLLANRKDMSAKRGLNALVTMRKSFLNYLYQSDPSKATDMAKELGIRFRPKGRLWDKDSKYGAYKNTKSKYQKIRAAKRAQRKPVDAEPVSA